MADQIIPCEKTDQRVLNIDAGSRESAAIFLATLAYPGIHEGDKRAGLIEAMRVGLARNMVYNGIVPQKAIKKSIRSSRTDRAIKTIYHAFHYKILTARLRAALIAFYVIAGRFSSINISIDHLINEMSGRHRPNDPDSEWLGGDSSNIYRKIWTPSKPVLHLAMAIHPLICGVAPPFDHPYLAALVQAPTDLRKSLGIKKPYDLIPSNDWVSEILQIAQEWQEILPIVIPSIEKLILIKTLP